MAITTQLNLGEYMSSADMFVITPSDATDLTKRVRAIWVGTGGNIVVVPAKTGTSVTIKNIPSGYRLDGVFDKVLATGTTATDLVGMA